MTTNHIKEIYSIFKNSSGISTDTRTIKNNSIYFALKGPSFNGNDFAREALEKGAKLSVVDDESLDGISDRMILVKDSLEALQKLSEKWNIVIFTAKGRPDRPLVNGMTGIELVEEWLEKHDVLQYIDYVTWEKPRAEYYIDDKGLHFNNNWDEILEEVL